MGSFAGSCGCLLRGVAADGSNCVNCPVGFGTPAAWATYQKKQKTKKRSKLRREIAALKKMQHDTENIDEKRELRGEIRRLEDELRRS